MHSKNSLGMFAVVATLALSGCVGAPDVQYQPSTAANAATKASVGLNVTDKRSAEHRGNGAQIGQIRGSFGIPHGVDDKKSDVAVKTVTDATTDALRKSAVGVQNGNKTLVAAVKEFWFDGFMGFAATVTVSYQLTDASGKVLWSADVTGKAGDSAMFSNAKEVAEMLLPRALADLASKAGEQFNTPAFQQALAM